MPTPARTGTTSTPTLPSITETQLDPYAYTGGSVDGSNVVAAWQHATGSGVAVAVIDDGFTPSLLAQFDSADSASFGAAGIGEPSGGFHGTTTSGLIGDAGSATTPVGLAPGATIVGMKVDFAGGSFSEMVSALTAAMPVAAVINNSWGLTGYGNGAPGQAGMAPWYAAVQSAVASARGGLGDTVVFAAGNDRANADTVSLQPIVDDPRVIAVAATNRDGTVASFSNPGPGLLVAAEGNGVTVTLPSGTTSQAAGTSYAAPAVSAIVAMMLQANPNLGWRDVQAILAESAYAPLASASGFSTNAASGWNGGGMHFSNDLGFGVVDANVAVNLARAWTAQSTSANQATLSATQARSLSVAVNGNAYSTVSLSGGMRVQHVQVHIDDINLPVAFTKLVLTSPSGTQSVLLDHAGLSGGTDLTGGLDLSGDTISSNAFWGEAAAGTWTLSVQDAGGQTVGQVQDWTLTATGDPTTAAPPPLVYTPEFARLAAAAPARTQVGPGATGATTIDAIALPGPTYLNLNGGGGMIDGVGVTVQPGLQTLNADGSTGMVFAMMPRAGGSVVGGDGVTIVYGGGGADRISAGLGTTLVWALGDPGLTFIGGGGQAVVHAGHGAVDVQAGSGPTQLVLTNGGAGGLETLSNYTASVDTVDLVGYAPGAAATAIATQTSDGHGGSLLHLADGTRIDVAGVAHASQSLFA